MLDFQPARRVGLIPVLILSEAQSGQVLYPGTHSCKCGNGGWVPNRCANTSWEWAFMCLVSCLDKGWPRRPCTQAWTRWCGKSHCSLQAPLQALPPQTLSVDHCITFVAVTNTWSKQFRVGEVYFRLKSEGTACHSMLAKVEEYKAVSHIADPVLRNETRPLQWICQLT